RRPGLRSRAFGASGRCHTSRSCFGRGTDPTARWPGPCHRTSGTAVMAKAPKVAGLGQNGERIDGSDARDRAQKLIIGMAAEKRGSTRLDGVAALDQASPLCKHEAEHPEGLRGCATGSPTEA